MKKPFKDYSGPRTEGAGRIIPMPLGEMDWDEKIALDELCKVRFVSYN